jgi:hypothetical protein
MRHLGGTGRRQPSHDPKGYWNRLVDPVETARFGCASIAWDVWSACGVAILNTSLSTVMILVLKIVLGGSNYVLLLVALERPLLIQLLSRNPRPEPPGRRTW